MTFFKSILTTLLMGVLFAGCVHQEQPTPVVTNVPAVTAVPVSSTAVHTTPTVVTY